MAQVSTYLNFVDSCEAAFEFYKSVFGTDYVMPPSRYSDMAAPEGSPAASPEIANLIMNIQLPILAGHLLMGSDVPAVFTGSELKTGDNVQICLHADSRDEADALYAALSAGGTATMPLEDQFWGDYYGELKDKFGVTWLLIHSTQA